jgi:hypothetical protein
VARASREKETRASCSSANSILAPLRQVSETREPCAVELKDMRDVDSLTFRVRDAPISTNPVALLTMAAYSCSCQPTVLSNSLAPSHHASFPLASFAKPSSACGPALVPRSLDKRPLTAARLSLPVTCLVLPAMSPSPVVCIHAVLHPKSAVMTARELDLEQTAAMPFFAIAHHCP